MGGDAKRSIKSLMLRTRVMGLKGAESNVQRKGMNALERNTRGATLLSLPSKRRELEEGTRVIS